MFKWRHAMRAAGLGIAIYACSGATNGQAADMPLFGGDPAPQTKVEFGTGWYIRGDAAWVFDKAPIIDPDGTLLTNQTQNSWSADLGAGYKFNNWFRGDMTLGIFGPQSANGNGAQVNCPQSINGLNDSTGTPIGLYAVPSNCTPIQEADLKKQVLLVNGYIDLGTWYGFTPFIGAGVGAARIQEEGSVSYVNSANGSPYNASLTLPSGYPVVFYGTPTVVNGVATQTPLANQPKYNYGVQNWNSSYSKIKYNFAWAVMAGVAYNLTDNAALELGYRYVNFGTFQGLNPDGSTFSKNLSAQEIRVGVRYVVDGM